MEMQFFFVFCFFFVFGNFSHVKDMFMKKEIILLCTD